MKKILKATLISTILLGTSLLAEDSNSAKHFGYSAVFGYVSETVIHDKFNISDVEKVGYSTIIGSIPGLIKELNDSKFDNEDMAFDVAGAFAGSLLSNYLNNNIFVSIDEHNGEKRVKVAANYSF